MEFSYKHFRHPITFIKQYSAIKTMHWIIHEICFTVQRFSTLVLFRGLSFNNIKNIETLAEQNIENWERIVNDNNC